MNGIPKKSTSAGESARLEQLWRCERELHAQGYQVIAGVDEAGRGPLAGPVIAAAVVFTPPVALVGLDDSKKLSPSKRLRLWAMIQQQAASVGLGAATAAEIDQLNILQASLLAMRRAIAALNVIPDLALLDGNQLIPNFSIPQQVVIQGDQRCFSIAAASIIAKVRRDQLMLEWHARYPQYGFDRHKGYPTPQHVAALQKYGYCPIHRRSFSVRGMP